MFTIDHTEAIFSFCRQFYNVTLLPITCFDGRTQESRSYPDRFDMPGAQSARGLLTLSEKSRLLDQ